MIGAVIAAFNFCCKFDDLDVNPVAGYSKPAATPRVTVFSPEEEQAIYETADEALGAFIKACILTGAKPYSELATVTADHVVETPQGMYYLLRAKTADGRQGHITGTITDPDGIPLRGDELGNRLEGVLIDGGGAHVLKKNLVSGNFVGVRITGDAVTAVDNVVAYNRIGTNADRNEPLPNDVGVMLEGDDNTVMDNLISGNRQEGVLMDGDGNRLLSNRIVSNTIFGNGRLGIDLGNDGVTWNDLGDVDTGANNLQNFPLLISATTFAGTTAVRGTLDSTPGSEFRLEFSLPFHRTSPVMAKPTFCWDRRRSPTTSAVILWPPFPLLQLRVSLSRQHLGVLPRYPRLPGQRWGRGFRPAADSAFAATAPCEDW